MCLQTERNIEKIIYVKADFKEPILFDGIKDPNVFLWMTLFQRKLKQKFKV